MDELAKLKVKAKWASRFLSKVRSKYYVSTNVIDRLDSLATEFFQYFRTNYTPSIVFMYLETVGKTNIKDGDKKLRLDLAHRLARRVSQLSESLEEIARNRKISEFRRFLDDFVGVLKEGSELTRQMIFIAKENSVSISEEYETTREIFNHLLISFYGFLNNTACLHKTRIPEHNFRNFLLPKL